MTIEELEEHIAASFLRVIDSPPEDTVAMATAFMATFDAIGPEAAHTTTLAEFFVVFTLIYKALVEDD